MPEDASSGSSASREGSAPDDGGGDRTSSDRRRSGEPEPPAVRHRADEPLPSEVLPDSLRCPHCGEEESEQFAAFGSAVSVSQYYCRSCRTVFEAFKWR